MAIQNTMYDIEYVTGLTNFDSKKIDTLVSYFAGLDEMWKIKVVGAQIEKSYKMSPERLPKKKAEFYFACFLIAIHDVKQAERKKNIPKHLRRSVTDESIEQLRATQITRRNKESKTTKMKEIELHFLPTVRELREKGLSWREISEYIKTYHRKTYSYEHLRKTYKDHCE